jgi:hypothetical protein
MIQNVKTSFPLFKKATIIRAANPFRSVVIRLLLYNKYYWVAMMDFEYHTNDLYYVGKEFNEAYEAYKTEVGVW